MSSKGIIERVLRLFRLKGRDNSVLIDETPTAEEEEDFFEKAPQSIDDAKAWVDLRGKDQDIGERLLFHDRAFFVSVVWIVFLVLLPFVQMTFSVWGFGLSDAQFIAVVGSTTAAVFGFWLLVGKYLFK